MSARPDGRPPALDPRTHDALEALLGTLEAGAPDRDLVEEVLRQAVGMCKSGELDRGELKILLFTLRDFARSFSVFDAHRDRQKVAIFGSARTPVDSPLYDLCRRLAARLVEHDFMVITGAGPGIMRAGNEGAGRENSFGVNINLPFEQSSNDIIAGDPKLVNFKYFFTRKLSFVKECDAIVLFPGGFGTMDEGFEALTLLQTGKCDPLPVILMDVPGSNYWPSWERYVRENLLNKRLISPYDRNLFRVTSSVERAVHEIEFFYSTYHSLRYVGSYCILRLRRPPSEELMTLLNERYPELLAGGRFEVLDGPHPAEKRESEAVKALPRIGFEFVQRGYGLLRRLIDDINLVESDEPGPVPYGRRPEGGHLPQASSADAKED